MQHGDAPASRRQSSMDMRALRRAVTYAQMPSFSTSRIPRTAARERLRGRVRVNLCRGRNIVKNPPTLFG